MLGLDMKKKSSCGVWILLLFLTGVVSTRPADAACRNPNLVLGDTPIILPAAAASRFVEITWFGHSFFQLTSSSGTRIITDPFGPMGYPMPEVRPHVVTVGREHGNHNNVGLAKGDPLVLRGLSAWGGDWSEVNVTFRDVLIYSVPIHTRSWQETLKGAAFVFEMDGLCVCHSGDLGEPFNEDQLDLIGHVDILLITIGGRYAMGPENAKSVVEQLKPKIAVPMHYFNNTFALDRFLEGPYRARFFDTNTFSVSKDTLPVVTEIYVPKVLWHGWEDDR